MRKRFLFISRLELHRSLEHISQTDLAKELNITRQTIAAIEKGIKKPSLLTAFRLAQYFKTTIDALFTFKEF